VLLGNGKAGHASKRQLAQLLKRTQSTITYAVSWGKAIVEDISYMIE
jgi:hypothetical protein